MNMQKAWLVFKKDWLEIKRNWQVLLPIILLPLFFSVVFPIVISSVSNVPTQDVSNGDFQLLTANLPADVQALLAEMTPNQVMVYIMVLYFFAPFFLIIPVMASSVMASDSFAGERERKTIEALLATPISNSELLMGKILVSFIPAIIVTIASFGVYSIIVDIITFEMFNGILLLPNANWLIIIFGVAPAIAICSIGLTVIISAKVKGFKEAQQISVILLLPVLGLVFGQMSGLIILGPLVLTALIGILALVDVAIIYAGVRVFQREEILAKNN